MNRIIALLLAILLSSCAHWDKSEKAMGASFVAGQTINYAQTKYVLENDNWHEINGIVGSVGSDLLLPYKLGTTAAILGIADRLDHKKRKWLLGAANIVVWGFVIHDLEVGVGFKFSF